MSFRDWLIVVGVVIILGILADGYRRMRQAKMDSLKMSKNMGGNDIENTPIDDDYNPELPTGGARVISPGSDTGSGEPYISDDLAVESEISEEPIVADRDDRAGGAALDSVTPEPETVQTTEVDENEATTKDQGPSEVMVINVDAKNGGTFAGVDIKKLLEACGLAHGEMSIFHRHEEEDLLSPVQFSVANAVEPGYFDPAKMNDLTTPGVSFFMSLPGPKDSMKAFEYMLETAQCFATNLNGELSDERRSVLTKQTIEHCRHRVREFERKQQLSLSKA